MANLSFVRPGNLKDELVGGKGQDKLGEIGLVSGSDNLNNLSVGSKSTGIMGDEDDAIFKKWVKADLFLELLGIIKLSG